MPEKSETSFVAPVLGVPVRFASADASLLDAAEELYGWWAETIAAHPLGGPEEHIDEPLVRLFVEGDATRTPESLAFETEAGGTLRASAEGVRSVARVRTMEAEARVAPVVAASTAALRLVLDTLVLHMIGRLDREPVHAAVIAAGGRGVVLAGPSGVGKSTLAYAAHRAGMTVVTDNTAYIQLRPTVHVWGMPGALHVSPDAVRWFPELTDAPLRPRPNGVLKHVLDLPPPAAESAGDGRVRRALPRVGRASLCILERAGETRAGARESGDRHDGDDALLPRAVIPIDPEDAVARVTSRLEPGFDWFKDTIPRRLRALAESGSWLVRVRDDPRATVAAIAEHVLGP